MGNNDYSKYSLQELYTLYTQETQNNNTDEAKIIFEQILIKEKSQKTLIVDNNLASRSERLGAILIDSLFVGVPIFAFLILRFGFNGILELQKEYGLAFSVVSFLVGQAIYLIANGWLLFKYGQTIGKKLMSIKIVDQKEVLPPFYRVYGLRQFLISLIVMIPILGNFFSIVDALFIFRNDKRCIHDHLAETKVVKVA